MVLLVEVEMISTLAITVNRLLNVIDWESLLSVGLAQDVALLFICCRAVGTMQCISEYDLFFLM